MRMTYEKELDIVAYNSTLVYMDCLLRYDHVCLQFIMCKKPLDCFKGVDCIFVFVFQLYEEYDDTEIGALDQDEIEGSLQQGSTMLNSLIDEFEKEQKLK